jgi:hypothetical protein
MKLGRSILLIAPLSPLVAIGDEWTSDVLPEHAALRVRGTDREVMLVSVAARVHAA